MKTFFLFVHFFILVFIVNSVDGHAQEKVLFGEKIAIRKITPICDLFDYGEKYNGQTVTIKGIVDDEDARGNWFYIDGGECRTLISSWKTDIITTDLTGKTVLVQGLVKIEKMGEIYMPPNFIPTGIEIQK